MRHLFVSVPFAPRDAKVDMDSGTHSYLIRKQLGINRSERLPIVTSVPISKLLGYAWTCPFRELNTRSLRGGRVASDAGSLRDPPIARLMLSSSFSSLRLRDFNETSDCATNGRLTVSCFRGNYTRSMYRRISWVLSSFGGTFDHVLTTQQCKYSWTKMSAWGTSPIVSDHLQIHNALTRVKPRQYLNYKWLPIKLCISQS
jgi:hypothetical protein